MNAARVFTLSTLPSFTSHVTRWGLPALSGRIVELSGRGASAGLTAAFGLVLEAQHREEPAAWITLRSSSFFPPDARAGGIDLGALSIVRVKAPNQAARAADQIVRSGGFGLVVLDLGACELRPGIPAPLLTRLLGLAQKHDTAVVVLTEKPSTLPSLSSIVSLRAEVVRARAGDRWEVRLAVLKDKRRGPGGAHTETCHGPTGLR